MFRYIITFLHNTVNTVLQLLFCQIRLPGGCQCSGQPHLLSFFPSFTMCAVLFFSSTLNTFPFFSLRQMLSLSCSHLLNPPIHRTVCPSPSNSDVVINFLTQLFICTMPSKVWPLQFKRMLLSYVVTPT